MGQMIMYISYMANNYLCEFFVEIIDNEKKNMMMNMIMMCTSYMSKDILLRTCSGLKR
jgi:hypothetical protein